jgi:CRP-like cAMP-binding protein
VAGESIQTKADRSSFIAWRCGLWSGRGIASLGPGAGEGEGEGDTMEAERLKDLPLFEGMSHDALVDCASLFQQTEMLAGSSLASEGDFAYKFFVVLDGEAEVYRDFKHVADLTAGDFFGEMGVISGQRRNARVTAKSRCTVAWMMTWNFQKMSEKFPEISAKIDAVVAERAATLPKDEG